MDFHYQCVDKMIKQNHSIISQLAPLDHFLNGMFHFQLKLTDDQLQELKFILSDINFENYEVKLEDVCQKFLGTVLETYLIDYIKKIIKPFDFQSDAVNTPLNKHLWKLCESVINEIYFDVLINTVQTLFIEVHVLAHTLLRMYNHEDRKEVLCTCYHVLRHFLAYLTYYGYAQETDYEHLMAKARDKDCTIEKEHRAIERERLVNSLTLNKVYYTFRAHAATLKKICDLYEEAYPEIKLSKKEITESSYLNFKYKDEIVYNADSE